MSSVEHLREFMNERLTAAAEEIFRVFHKTIIEYEEEIDRQRRLLDIIKKPEIKLHRTELPQQHVCRKENLTDKQLCNQERNSSLDQEDPEPPQIKEEQEELCTSLEGEQLVVKQETETFISSATCEESDNSEDQTLDLMIEDVVSVSVKRSEVPETNSDDQLLSHNSHVAESQDLKGGKQGDSGSTRNTETKPQKRHYKTKSHGDNVRSPTTSKIQLDTGTGKTVLKCGHCGKSFKYLSHLKVHHRVHTGERPYTCDTCGKKFSQVGILKEHMIVHTGEKPYPCDTCGKRFTQVAKVKRHMRMHTGDKPYPCNTCEKKFTQLSALKQHMRIHTGEKPYPCDTCEKRFSHLSVLRQHMRTHTGEKPYLCNTCGKQFSRPDALKSHMRIHTGEKPYSCDTCGKKFAELFTLKVHKRVHTGEKPYPCDNCGKQFAELGTLKNHMRIHTGEKPYSCNTCGKGFSQQTTLNMHMRVHTR
ncbi:gastrula zinc finger protein XlCGF57.1-like [Scomber japonicus]|uniref:gastrula zinc finger protein XlCGF57.1-like n=1 Tax=Scomber japonicus TaxID=13676 RepID=UPI002304EFA5|nr:gastrula zinc finger protein XlCGF57.1-like [Scomber japonicus]